MELSVPVLAVLAVGALDLIVAGVIVLQNPRSAVNLSFGLFALSGTCWAFGMSFFLGAHDPAWIDFAARLLYAGGSGVTAAFLYFALVFRLDKWPPWYENLAVALPFVTLSYLFFFSDVLVGGYAVTAGDVRGFAYGPLHYLFDIILWSNFLIALYIYGQIYYRAPDASKRRQALVIMLGTYINVALAATTNIVGPSFFNYFDYLWVGPFAMVVWIISVAYAVSRYQFFNMRVIATEIFVMLLWVFLLARVLISTSTQDFWINTISFIVAFILGMFLVRGVIREVEQRERIQAQEKELEVANERQEGLLHFISHEIKGYLTKNEAAFAAISAGDYGQVSPQLGEMSGAALTDTRKGVETVMDILDASNLKKGTVAFKKESFDIMHAVADTVSDLLSAAAQKGLKLSFKKPVEGAPFVGDEDKLRRHVFRNLIDNSIKYTPSGEVSVELQKQIGAYRFVVSDTGVGITPEDMKNLFTEGGHGKDSIKVNVHSTGYGLFIAKQVVEAHGGKVWAESEGAGKGSRFIAELPVH